MWDHALGVGGVGSIGLRAHALGAGGEEGGGGEGESHDTRCPDNLARSSRLPTTLVSSQQFRHRLTNRRRPKFNNMAFLFFGYCRPD